MHCMGRKALSDILLPMQRLIMYRADKMTGYVGVASNAFIQGPRAGEIPVSKAGNTPLAMAGLKFSKPILVSAKGRHKCVAIIV